MRQDIGLTNNDCLITAGDFTVVESDEQHILDTIAAFAGWWKEYPEDGIGVAGFQRGSVNAQKVQKDIRIQLESDGYKVTNPKVTLSTDGQLIIEPNATI